MGKSIFDGRVQIKYSYGCYGMTRGGGKTWHGGMDIVGVDSDIILMPYYEMPDGTQKPIKGRVTRARIVTDHSDRTWEWGYYVCVQLDADQTPDAVNFMYFCHCSRLLVDVGDRVISGQQLAIMGETGNAEGTHPHCHLKYEPRPAARGLTLRPMQPSPTRQASMALLRQRTSLPKSLPTAKKLPLLFCRTSLLALSAVAMPPQLLRSARNTARRQTATLMLRITCRSSASAAWCRLLQTLCWRFARNAS